MSNNKLDILKWLIENAIADLIINEVVNNFVTGTTSHDDMVRTGIKAGGMLGIAVFSFILLTKTTSQE